MPLAIAGNTQYNYNIPQSVQFRSYKSSYFSRTPTVAGSQNTWTVSFWVKRGPLYTEQLIFSAGASGAAETGMYITAGGEFRFYDIVSGVNNCDVRTTAIFRDPAAWYHVVVIYASNNPFSASDRLKIYINGVQQTSFSSAVYPINNQQSAVNNTVPQYIGRYAASAAYYGNYAVAEFNLIDGQAVSPNYFGKTDPVTGAWVPVAYYGTYSYPNSCYLPFKTSSQSTYVVPYRGARDVNVANPTAALDFGTNDWTIECFVSCEDYISGPVIYDGRPTGVNGFYPCLYVSTDGTVRYYVNSADRIVGSVVGIYTWNHIALCRKSGLTRLFLNGVQVGSTYSDSTNYVNGAARPMLGGNGFTLTGSRLNGAMSNVRVLNGTGLYASNFTPPSGPLPLIQNTQLLTFQNSTLIDNSPNNYSLTNNGPGPIYPGTPFNPNAVLGYDASTNGNNWTPNNVFIDELGYGVLSDSLTDTPTLTSGDRSNFCTLNPLWSGAGGTFYTANLYYEYTPANWATATGTFGVSSGKWYWENYYNSGTYMMYGIMKTLGTTDVQNLNTYPGQYADGYGYFSASGAFFNNSAAVAYGPTYTAGDVIGIALNMDAGTLTFYKNGVSLGVALTGLTGTWTPAVGVYGSGSFFNAGQQPFFYDLPAGYQKLNAYNLPTPIIPAGNKYMDQTLYTGTGTTQTVTNAAGFQPDFVWVKSRNSGTTQHELVDSVRGANSSVMRTLFTANQDIEESTNTSNYIQYGLIQSINSNGFTVTPGASSAVQTSYSGYSYVAWQWQAGKGTNVTNTAGSVTSTVSANPTSGFSVVTFTVPASGVITVGHGLGVAPGFITVKSRTNAPSDWVTYTAGLGPNQYLLLNGTNAAVTSSAFWNNTAPTSSVFTLGSGYMGYGNLVAYCWAEIPGFSKITFYTGNGSGDGTFVYCGFRPTYIMYKSAAATAWIILDSARSPYNSETGYLLPYLTNSEANTGATPLLDFVSNGFKLRFAGVGTNGAGEGITFIAFAVNPFKYANAR